MCLGGGAYAVVSGSDVVAHARAACDERDHVGNNQKEDRHVQDIVRLYLFS